MPHLELASDTHNPASIANWIKIRAILRPKSRGMNFTVSRCSSSVV